MSSHIYRSVLNSIKYSVDANHVKALEVTGIIAMFLNYEFYLFVGNCTVTI